jgi:hypothetical protein
MKSLAALVFLTLLCAAISGPRTYAQDSDRGSDKDRPASSANSKDDEDAYEEQENLQRLRAKMAREHSDSSGKPRPDLFDKGIGHLQRMKVVHEAGPLKDAEAPK